MDYKSGQEAAIANFIYAVTQSNKQILQNHEDMVPMLKILFRRDEDNFFMGLFPLPTDLFESEKSKSFLVNEFIPILARGMGSMAGEMVCISLSMLVYFTMVERTETGVPTDEEIRQLHKKNKDQPRQEALFTSFESEGSVSASVQAVDRSFIVDGSGKIVTTVHLRDIDEFAGDGVAFEGRFTGLFQKIIKTR